MGSKGRTGSAVETVVTILAALALAVTFLGAGFAACAVPPQTTELFSRLYSGSPDTPFSHAQLVQAAVETRDYTVGQHDRASLFAVLHDINEAAGTPYAAADELALAQAPETYTLTEDALSHLDDVYRVVQTAQTALIGIAVFAVGSCIFLGVRTRRRRVGGVLIGAGAGIMAVFVGLGAWAIADFYGFFAAFHSLFFSSGTWTFSADSLLITMYPLDFWMGMGMVWLAVTGVLSILAIVVGAALRRSGSGS